jgi:hypothetical protein
LLNKNFEKALQFSIFAQKVVSVGALLVKEARGGGGGHAAVRAPFFPVEVGLRGDALPHAHIDQWHAAATPLVARRRQGAQVGGRSPKIGRQKISIVFFLGENNYLCGKFALWN